MKIMNIRPLAILLMQAANTKETRAISVAHWLLVLPSVYLAAVCCDLWFPMAEFSDLRLALTFASVLAGVLLLQTLLTTAAIFGLALARFPGAWALWQASALFNSVDRAAGAMGYGDDLAYDLQNTRSNLLGAWSLCFAAPHLSSATALRPKPFIRWQRYLRRNKCVQLLDLQELLRTMQEAISIYEAEMGFGNV